MANVSSNKVLSSALKSRVRQPIVTGLDSRSKLYVASSGIVNSSTDLDRVLAQIADAQRFLRGVRRNALAREKRAA